jgi:hypothetical protein
MNSERLDRMHGTGTMIFLFALQVSQANPVKEAEF